MAPLNSATRPLFVPIKVEEENIYDGIKQLLKKIRPQWPLDNIKFKLFTDGITNKLVACQPPNEPDTEIVLVRIYGNKTDLLIDRNAEIRNILTLNKLDLAPRVYGTFVNGLAYQYYPGVTLNTSSVVDKKIWPLVARKMAQMHKVKLPEDIPKEPFLWDKIEQFLTLLPEPFNTEEKQKRFVTSFGSITKLRIEFERIKSHLIKTESPVVFAHNDLLLGNVIYNKDDEKISFIDYEYATYNYQAFDIANHFNEFVGISVDDMDFNRHPTRDFQISWIKEYLNEYYSVQPSDQDVEMVYRQVQLLSVASHFLWGIWSLVQYEHSTIDFDFERYARLRLNRYYEIKDQILKDFS